SGGMSFEIQNQNSGGARMINGNASVSIGAGTISSFGAFDAGIFNNFSGVAIHGNAMVEVNTNGFFVGADNPSDATLEVTNIFGRIDNDAMVTLMSGDVEITGGATFQIM